MRQFMIAGVAASAGLLCMASASSAAVTFDWATVGDPYNAPDRATGNHYGGVDHIYQIGTAEVTNNQYVAFLNAVDAGDIDGLYDTQMTTDSNVGGISRGGVAGSYTYSAISGRGNQPVTYVSWNDAARFVNWLSNGQQTGPAGAASVESGVYDMSQANPARAVNATIFLPTNDEWYKAAYYNPTLDGGAGGYYTYATKSNTDPAYEAPPGGSNSANYNGAANNPITGYLTDVGAYSASSSYYGTFDQSGNVDEWNETLFPESLRGFQGGAWTDSSSLLKAQAPHADGPTAEYRYLGFRVAGVPEPGSCILLLIVGGAALMRRQRSA